LNQNHPSRLQHRKAGEDLSRNDSSEALGASLSEPTARILCAALLADSREQTQSLLAAALREDPSFLIWTRSAAQEAGEAESLSEDALAQRLAQRLPELLQGTGAGTGGFAELLPALAKKIAQLKILQSDFAAAVQQEKLSALAEFAAGAGHEINNPLTVIAGRAQLLLHEETDLERRHALALMNTQAMRVHEMIADLMLFARPPQPHPAKVDVRWLFDNVVREMKPVADRQETVLSTQHVIHKAATGGRADSSGETTEITADPVQLMVALKAIVQNSLEALGSGGHVELELRASPACVEILVRDDGPGIPVEVRPHVFDPFFSARQAGRGLGLGLAKAWRIVTNHGGRITVESPPGPGTVICITLPIRQ
jgi:signal transduction histidine kinase